MIAYRLVLCALAAISAVPSVTGGVEAQAYPDRLIKMVVPYPPGGPIDTTARLVVQRLGPILGQTVIIENRAGAGGALGTKAVAGAEPDGYTLLFGNASALVVGPAVYRFRDYDTVKHFTPIAKVTEGYEVLVVAPDFPAKNVQELVAYAKARPGKLNFGSMGYGNLTHLAAELFKLQTGTDFVHVPYKGSPEAVAGIVAGEVHILFGEVAGLLPLVRAGKIRALGVASAARNALAPDLPTMSEGGRASSAPRCEPARRRNSPPSSPGSAPYGSTWWRAPTSRRSDPLSVVAGDYGRTGLLRRDDRHQQERFLVAAGIDRVLSRVVVSVVMRVRRAADAVARLDVEADAVAFFEHHRGRPNLHLYLDDLVGLEPLPPQMLVIGSIRPR